MKTKKVNQIILFSVLLCILFAGCANTKTGESSKATDATSASTGATATSADDKAASSLPIVTGGNVKLTIMRSDTVTCPFKENTPVLNELEKRTGITFEIQSIPQADYGSKNSTLLASNDVPDIMMTTGANYRTFAPMQVFLPVEDYMDILPNYANALKDYDIAKYYNINGKRYGFLRIAKYGIKNGNLPMIRKDMLDKVGMEVPESFDELFKVLEAFKEYDPNSYPWTCRNGNIISCVGYAFGAGPIDIYYEDAKDAYLYGPASEHFADLLAYLNKAYVQGILDPDYTTATQSQWLQNLSSDKSYFYFDNGTFAAGCNSALKTISSDARIVGIDTLKNAYGQQRNRYYQAATGWDEAWVVGSNTKYPEEAMRLMDYLYSEEGFILTNYGFEGEDFVYEGDKIKIKDDLVKSWNEKADDGWRAWKAERGLGYECFATYLDQTVSYNFLDQEEISFTYAVWEADKNISSYVPNPILTDAEEEEATAIRSKLSTLVSPEVDKFIMGLRDLSEYPAFIQEMEKAGVRRLEEIYAGAYARIK